MHIVARIVVRLLAWVVGCVWAVPVLVQVFIAFVSNPKGAFARKVRTYPAVLSDPALGTHGYVTANGQRIHFVESGPKDGPLMLCLHGFPEFWYTWRHQLPFFSGEYRVVAMDMRGFGESSKPASSWSLSAAFTMKHLVEDVRCVVEALGHKSCVLVAHDWGALVAWSFASLHGNMVDQLIVMNCPHPVAMKKNMSLKQFLRSWYIFFFQLPLLPELLVSLNDFMFLVAVFKGKAKGYKLSKITDDELNAYKWALSQPGALTCALNYYRESLVSGVRGSVITCPVLVLWGTEDHALGAELLAGTSPTFASDMSVVNIQGSSHFVNCDAHGQVNAAMAAFLKSRKSV